MRPTCVNLSRKEPEKGGFTFSFMKKTLKNMKKVVRGIKTGKKIPNRDKNPSENKR